MIQVEMVMISLYSIQFGGYFSRKRFPDSMNF